MQFSEAMKFLKGGARVTRQEWIGTVYFVLEENNVNSYQPILNVYNYTDDIMISDGWLVEGQEGEFHFYDIIPFLSAGGKAKLKDWKESFIYLDKTTSNIISHSMDVRPYVPNFQAFISQDWVVLNAEK